MTLPSHIRAIVARWSARARGVPEDEREAEYESAKLAIATACPSAKMFDVAMWVYREEVKR